MHSLPLVRAALLVGIMESGLQHGSLLPQLLVVVLQLQDLALLGVLHLDKVVLQLGVLRPRRHKVVGMSEGSLLQT